MRAAPSASPSCRSAWPSKWTRSSPSGPDRLDPGPAGFAHRGLHSGPTAPENTLAAFEAALEAGAGIECDLRLTADERIVVFHDPDAERMCGNPSRIDETALAGLAALRVGAEPIPTLMDLLDLVKGKRPLLLEVKADRDVARWGPALWRELDDYNGPFGIMSFDPRIARLVKSSRPAWKRGIVVRDSLPAARRRFAMWLADPEFLAVERTALGKPWVRRARNHMPVYSWTIRTAEQRRQAEVHADGLIWEGDGGPRI